MGSIPLVCPKIWLKASDYSGIVAEPDCDCACPVAMSPISPEMNLGIWMQKLHAETSQVVSVDQETFVLGNIDEHQIIINKSTGNLVVVDSEAGHLLSLLPMRLKELRKELSAWQFTVLDQTLALLCATHTLSIPQTLMASSNKQELATLTVWLHLTEACNMACVYCYAPKTSHRMSATTAQCAVDVLFRSAQAHGFQRVKIKYAGGEPTLNFGVLQVAQKHAESLSAQYGLSLDTVMLTNGLAITEEQIDFLLEHAIRVSISLDALGSIQDAQRPQIDGRNSSASVISALNRLRIRGIQPHVSITLTRRNLPYLHELVSYLLERQLPFSFNFYRPTSNNRATDPLAFSPTEAIESLNRAFDILEKQLPEFSLLAALSDRANLNVAHPKTCGVGENYMVIGTQGEVYKCQMDLGNSKPVTTLADNDPLAYLRTDVQGIQNLRVEDKECRDCMWRYFCTGGCPRLTYQQTGRYDAKSPLCELYQEILPRIVRLEALRLMQYEKQWVFVAR